MKNLPTEKLAVGNGLPQEVKFCVKCVFSNQRPSNTVEFKNLDKKEAIVFDELGVCSGCRQHEQKWENTDYEARQKILEQILDKHRSKNGNYDVVVPGSGGKDSMYVSHVLKHKYGMHPLTVTWPPHMYTNIGRQNFETWIREFDNVTTSPNVSVHRRLTRDSFLNLLHPFQPFILGQKFIGPKVAMQYGIKLVMYGESESEGGSKVDPLDPKMDSKFFAVPRAEQKNIIIGKRYYNELIESGLTHTDLLPYLPIVKEDYIASGVNVYYMSFFENWRSQKNYYYALENCGFMPDSERTEGTFVKFSGLDDKIDGLQFYTTKIKFGIGRASYDASTEIRHRYIDRDEGVSLVRKYDDEFPKRYHQDCLEYMDISEEQFCAAVDRFRSPHIWKKDGSNW